MKYYETPAFRELQKQWYDKAAESGFKDIEYGEGTDVLRGFSSSQIASRGLREGPELMEYYCQATQWIKRARPGKHRRIWKLHAEGLSVRKIARRLRRWCKSEVHRVISIERAKMFEWLKSSQKS